MERKYFPVGVIFLFIIFSNGLKAHEDIPGALTGKRVDQNVPGKIDTSLYSRILGEDRRIVIWLPKTYKESKNASYPVLYLLDAELDFVWSNGVSTVAELCESCVIPDLIVVGIHNTNRNRDMIPDKVSHKPGSGGSKKFLQFITHELNPFIESNYSTNRLTILYGGSNAGLFTVYALLGSQEAIQVGIAASPMIGHCGDFMFDHLKKLLQSKRISERILFMVYGENDSKRVVDYVPEFLESIKNKAPGSIRAKMVLLENEGHVPPTSLRLGLVEIFKQSFKPVELR